MRQRQPSLPPLFHEAGRRGRNDALQQPLSGAHAPVRDRTLFTAPPQQNAALVEQGAAAAGSLHAQAQQLAEAVHVFRLDEPALA